MQLIYEGVLSGEEQGKQERADETSPGQVWFRLPTGSSLIPRWGRGFAQEHRLGPILRQAAWLFIPHAN